jgi:hypothetical protein
VRRIGIGDDARPGLQVDAIALHDMVRMVMQVSMLPAKSK